MLLHQTLNIKPTTIHDTQTLTHVSLSSSLSYSLSISSPSCSAKSLIPQKNHYPDKTISCSSWLSKVQNLKPFKYETSPTTKWYTIYKRIAMNNGPERGSIIVLNEWEKRGKIVSRWELSRIVKELRKCRRYKLALQVYEWMNTREERFRLTATDNAIQLDLIAKLKGTSAAEECFLKLPDTLKDRRIYGVLLNAYVQDRKKEQAETLFDKMRRRGYTDNTLPFNVMMTLYKNLKDYDKVESMVSEMVDKRIPLDIVSYNIWLSSCESLDKMENVLEKMNLDTSIKPTWSSFSTMANTYIKLGQLEKAKDCLINVECRSTGRDRSPHHYLISLYGSLGKKEEVHRTWRIYKSYFANIPNLGYHSVISSLLRLDDIEGAEKIYVEWLHVKSLFEPRIGNLLLGYYVRKGYMDKANAFFGQMIVAGGKPSSMMWEILAEGHIRERRLSQALSCLKDAVSTEGSKNWRPKPANISSILRLCEQEGDTQSKEVLFEVLKQVECLDIVKYMSYIPQSDGTFTGDESEIDEGSDILFDQL